jgi:guanosine-3',5'-bis(diphosphate) 3'-pyrophosphohydrolase
MADETGKPQVTYPGVYVEEVPGGSKPIPGVDTDPCAPAIQLIVKAAAFAAHKHRDQRRKDGAASPYINHPLGLAQILIGEGGVSDPVVLAAALLHDTLEDTETTYDELVEEFGAAIADIVREVTDDKELPKEERKRLQIEHAAHLSDRAKLVKLADKIANVRDVAHNPPPTWTLTRRQEYFDWAANVVAGIGSPNDALASAFAHAMKVRPS